MIPCDPEDGASISSFGNSDSEACFVSSWSSSSSSEASPAKPEQQKRKKQRGSRFQATSEDVANQAAWFDWVRRMVGLKLSKARIHVSKRGRPKEYYSGKGGWTHAACEQGFNPWPAIDLFDADGKKRTEHDLLNRQVVERELEFIDQGNVSQGFFGTPCTTMSMLFQQMGPGTRSDSSPEGSGLDIREIQGNIHAAVTMLLCVAIWASGGDFMIENPARSWLFKLSIVKEVANSLQKHQHWFVHVLHQCRYGLHPPDDPSKRYRKPTRIICSKPCGSLSKVCSSKGLSCNCIHVPIQGSVKVDGKTHLRSKLAGAYPVELSHALVKDLLATDT
jgi:hypothetical protein